MTKNSIQKIKLQVAAWVSRAKHTSVRSQVFFNNIMILAVTLLAGLVLGTISYETMQDYRSSSKTLSDLYEFNEVLDTWEAALDNYVFHNNDLFRQECTSYWERLGVILENFHVGEDESCILALANLRALYSHTEEEMFRLMSTADHSQRNASYAVLTSQKAGLLFLSDQMQRTHTETKVKVYPDIIRVNAISIFIFCLILFCAVVLMALCSRRVIRAICMPIDILVEDAKKMAAGQYDTPAVAILSDDEMGYLSQVFNNMKSQVSANFKNMERIIELQELLQNTELKALQSQINPHFLFNVLSVAEEAALYENADHTVEIMENISYMLQYSLKCTKQDTTFLEELRMVNAYLFLQEKRFGDRICFRLSVPDDLPQQLLIPGMTLQPVVENAIRHGVEKMESGGVVEVRVYRQADHIEVRISDNGCGIDQAMLAALQRGESVSAMGSSGSGIGLLNVLRRMEIFYKRDKLFEISSRPGNGTTVILQYPLTED